MLYPQFEPFKLISLWVKSCAIPRPGGFLKELSDSQGCGLCGLSRANGVNLEGCIRRTMTNPKAAKLTFVFLSVADGALPFQFGGNPHRWAVSEKTAICRVVGELCLKPSEIMVDQWHSGAFQNTPVASEGD